MKIQRMIFLTLLVAIIISYVSLQDASAITSIPSTNHPKVQSHSIPEVNDCGAPNHKRFGYKESSTKPAIPKERAIEIAKPFSLIKDEPSQVVAQHKLFTGNSAKKQYKDRSVWLISFCGDIHTFGPEPADQVTNHEMNIIVDATTGELILAYWYR